MLDYPPNRHLVAESEVELEEFVFIPQVVLGDVFEYLGLVERRVCSREEEDRVEELLIGQFVEMGV